MIPIFAFIDFWFFFQCIIPIKISLNIYPGISGIKLIFSFVLFSSIITLLALTTSKVNINEHYKLPREKLTNASTDTDISFTYKSISISDQQTFFFIATDILIWGNVLNTLFEKPEIQFEIKLQVIIFFLKKTRYLIRFLFVVSN